MTERGYRRITYVLGVIAGALALLTALLYLRRAPARTPELRPPERLQLSAAPLLDLNEATVEELSSLPGIGPVLAERMIAWREENGPFQSIEDVLDVPGIGRSTYESIRPYITY